MDIRACKMLREFHLNCSKLPNGLDPENFCSDFPHLETLLMGPEKPINISGSSLRKWILSIPQIMKRAWFLKLRSHLQNFSNHNTTLEIRIKGVIKKLYGRRNRNCCSGTHDKCWRHFLKYFEVKEEEEKEHPDAPSSLYAHPRKVKEDEKMDKLTKLIFNFFWKFNS
ncbi:hypothetical protein KY290_019122 [Solanum tuberosum]|uniref:Uncharacterized protein n=1 Tax=Solanum tuberosum TaxID=4113 RepID=A0ABQ7VG50_SOLTU|nr:hypothetical protein KY290_019122 [Solanum tuberosum]